MAETMDLGKDPNGPTHSSTLFVREDGSSISFYVRPSPAKRRLSTLILHGGGTLCRVQEPGAVLLAQPGEAVAEASGDFISTQYILDCVERNEKLDLEAYRLGSASAADQAAETKPGAPADGVAAEPVPLTGRMAFTHADDVAILTYVKENARSPNSVTGNALWKAMEKSSLTQHSWQALKDRYLKHLRGQEQKYLLADVPVSPSSQKLKRKAEQDPEAADSGEPQNKRTPDLPEEESERKEVQENEEAVKKMLIEATREFEEVAVDESPDFEIHITMCDDDPPTPEEDSETQPEEEEGKASPPEVGAAIKIIRQLMEKFNLDLSTVTQAFLKNSGSHDLEKKGRNDLKKHPGGHSSHLLGQQKSVIHSLFSYVELDRKGIKKILEDLNDVTASNIKIEGKIQELEKKVWEVESRCALLKEKEALQSQTVSTADTTMAPADELPVF